MTPGARLSAAIGVLDAALAGAPLEKALTGWARASRYAGSGDRAAVRDIVYDAWRCRRSFAALGGAETGRGLVLGGLRAAGTPPETLMTGEGHAAPPPTADEAGRAPAAGAEALDIPDWLWPQWQADLGDKAQATARDAQVRAPVFLRVNLRRGSLDSAIAALADDGVGARAHPHVKTALEVTRNSRKIARSSAYLDGLVELQDAASQDAVARLPLANGMRVLDYCAGGGGKALAMADAADLDLWAHDAFPARMHDLPTRAARAGVRVNIVEGAPDNLALFDLVLVDAPCSGSGTWRRDPEGKWRLTPARLAELIQLQQEILQAAAACVAPGGVLAYATCSVLRAESKDQISTFCTKDRRWTCKDQHVWVPDATGDGFSLYVLSSAATAT